MPGSVSARPLVPVALVLLLLLPPLAPALPGETGAFTAVVTFHHEPTHKEWAQFLQVSGDPAATRLTVVPGSVVTLSASAHRRVADLPLVHRVDASAALAPTLDHATRLSRAGGDLPDLRFTGDGVTVAVVDSGVDPRHPDLSGRVAANVRLQGGRFVESPGDADGHGTHVAGIVAGDGRASDGRHRGVAPDARVVGIDIRERFDTASALLAFDWILLNREQLDIRVVVNSWGRVERDTPYDPQDPVIAAVDRLVRSGLVLVFSASNHGPGASTLSIESMNPNVVTVGATDDAGLIADYSSRGPPAGANGAADWVKPDMVAAGSNVVSARSGTGLNGVVPEPPVEDPYYRSLSGTSQAAPLVAGIVACMLEANPRLSPAEVLDVLRRSAVDLGERGPDPAYGFGLVDAVDALHLAQGEAPDRANALIAGGEERYEDSGSLPVAAAGGFPIPVIGGQAARAEIEVPVKPGAESLDLSFRWQPASATFTLRLEDADGVTRGRWSAAEDAGTLRVVRGEHAPREPGVYRLVAEGTSTQPVNWDAVVHVTLPPHPERVNLLPPKYRLDAENAPTVDKLSIRMDYFLAKARLEYELWRTDPRAYVEENPRTFAAALAVVLLAGMGAGGTGALAVRRMRAR